MPKPAHKPNKVGEHQVLKKTAPKAAKATSDEDDDSRTERYPVVQEAFDESQKRFDQATGQS